MLREYADSEAQVAAALAYSGFDTFKGDSVSLAAFIGSFPFQRQPTQRLTEGTRSLSARILASAEVEVRHGWKLETLEVESAPTGQSGDKRLVFSTVVDGDKNTTATSTCLADAVVLALPPAALQLIAARSKEAASASPEEEPSSARGPAPVARKSRLCACPKSVAEMAASLVDAARAKTGSISSSELSGARRTTCTTQPYCLFTSRGSTLCAGVISSRLTLVAAARRLSLIFVSLMVCRQTT